MTPPYETNGKMAGRGAGEKGGGGRADVFLGHTSDMKFGTSMATLPGA